MSGNPDLDAVLALRQLYWANGYRPIEIWGPDQRVNDKGEPLNNPGKQPRGRWREDAAQDPPAAARTRPDPRALNTGLLSDDAIGFDVDILDPALSERITHMIVSVCGETPLVRIGLAPKTLLVFRAEEAFGKLQTPEMMLPNGQKAKVEVLAKGQQFVADGIHPDTGRPYTWIDESPESVHFTMLPIVTKDQASEVVRRAELLLHDAGAKPRKKKDPPKRKPNGRDGTFFELTNEAALTDIAAWARSLFPRAHFEPGTGAWRVSSKDLGRNLEEDISIHPGGIRDFGEETPLSPIDLVMRYAGRTAIEAALWLCDQLSIDPATWGYMPPSPPGRRNNNEDDRLDEGAWPDPADLLGGTKETAPGFPVDFLPGPPSTFAADAADRMQCPVDFVGIPLIIVAATLLGKGFRLAPKLHDDWSERPCLWGGIIAEIGALKSPAFDAALAPLRKFQANFHQEHQAELEQFNAALERARYAEKQWQLACKAALKTNVEMPAKPEAAEPPEKPTMRRLITGDATQEALADLLNQNPRGMLLFRDELSAWFAGFNQYRPGADRQFFLECHAGGAFAKDRRIGSTLIDDLYLNICGGFQPDVINKVLAGGDYDGMTARLSLLVWPDSLPAFSYIDRVPNAAAKRDTEIVLNKLLTLTPNDFFGPPSQGRERVFRFDDEAQLIFRDWYTKMRTARLAAYENEKDMRAHLSKYPGLFARLCIVHYLLRRASKQTNQASQLVDVETVKAVKSFIDDYLEPHARRIYRHLGQSSPHFGAKKIAQWIIGSPTLQSFTARDVRQKDWGGLTAQEPVNAALDYLENVAGWIRCTEDLPGAKAGRPTTRFVVNPKLIRQQKGRGL